MLPASTTLTGPPAPELLFDLRVAEAAVLLALLCASPLLKGPTSPGPAASNGHSAIVTVVRAVKVPRRQLILSLLSLAAFTAFLDGTVTVANAIFKHVVETQLPPWRGIEFYSVALLVAFAGLAVVGSFKDARGKSIWQSKLVKLFVLVALAFDIALAALIPLVVPIWKVYPNPAPHVPEDPEPIPPVGLAPAVHFGLTVLRALILLVLFPALFFPRTAYEAAQTESAPPVGETSLLIPATAAASAETSAGLAAPKAKYGTFNPAPSTAPPSRAHTPAPSIGGPSASTSVKPARTESLTWAETGARLRRLLPYLWPSKSIGLQFVAVICLLIVAVGRAVNAALPFKLSEVIEALGKDTARTDVWAPLFWYAGLKFLQGSGGLAALRDVLWAPVMQYSDRSMSQLCFDHLLNLSLAWHTRRKTGEVLRILDRGAAINHIFELLLFNVIPTLADISIALYIFFWYFGPVLSIVIAAVMVTYIALSITLTTWRTQLRRQMNESDVITRGIHTDCLLNYETVKYFGGERHEGERYRDAIARYQTYEYKVMASLNLLNLTQNFVISVGLLVGSLMVCLSPQQKPEESVKRFVVFITYLAQLYAPLNSLGYIYRSINQNLVDTERLVDLLDEPTEVQDKPDAKELVVTDGVIEFDNVTFSYDNRTTALNGISFTIPRGGSVALVGESGSGKSTILRLLYRFYDLAPGNGAIRIDGQDIRDVTQASLRKAIGVVPQDSVLFNNTIAYNIGYGKFGASAEEIENAARAAQMHERITSFPDGYETKVGERGVRLSGGEKQRVAIARTILKAPRVILLDEATSALDTTTERDIQKALQNLVDGRSSLSIAHRLSTIANSDVILVLHGGEIVESGSHRELVDRDGRFAAMWADQISSADETRTLPDTNKDDAGEVPGYQLDAPESDNQEAHILPVPAVDTPDNLSFNHPGEAVFGLGPAIVPPEQLVAAGVPSEHPVPIQPEEQPASDRPSHEVKPDVSFAAVAARETPDDGAKVEEAVKADEPAPETEAAAAEPAAKTDDAPKAEEVAAPAAFPKSDDASSVTGSARPALRETTSGTSSTGTPGGVTWAPGTEGERFRQAANRIRKISQGAAVKSTQRFAQIARRVSQSASRQGSMSPGFNREGSGSVRASMDVEGADNGSAVPAEQSAAAGVSSENEVKPDVSFAAVAAGETKDDAAKADEPTPEAEAPAAEPASKPEDVTTPTAFPQSDDAASLTGSARPPLRETTSGTSSNPGTPGGVSWAPGTDGERFRQAANRIRKISQGAATKSTQRFAQIARRVSQGPSRQGSVSSTGRVVSPPGSPGFSQLSREGSGSVRASMDVEGGDQGSVADSDKKKKDKKDKRKSAD